MPSVAFSLFAGAGWQFLDDNGVPLAGGLVYTYEAGTTTPAATYTSSAGTSANPNPIVLDAAGRPPAEIWVLSGDSYKFQVNTATDTPIRTYDNVPASDAGITPLIADLISTASGKGAGLIGFSQTAAYDAATVGLKLQESVCVDDHPFNAVGNGVADDTVAIQAAFSTGKTVTFTGGKTYKITDVIDFTAHGQKAFFNGAQINIAGNTHGFRITGDLYGCGIYDPILDGTAQSGGYMIYLSGADRTSIRTVRGHNPYNFLYAERFNLLNMMDCWINNVTGDYGIHCYGSDALRSDVLEMYGVTISSQNNMIGLLIDGQVHTVCTQGLRLVAPLIGVQYKNTSGGAIPLFFLSDDLEIDFPESYGIDLQVGEDFYFTNLYCHGSVTASGIRVGAAVPSGRVIVVDGKITGHALYGIDNPSTRVQIGNYVMSGNGSGDFSGDVYFKSAKIEVDDTYYMRMSAGDPLLNFAIDDFLGFVRATNTFFVNIAATARFRVTDASNGVEIYVNGALKEVQVGAADSGGVGYRMLRVTN